MLSLEEIYPPYGLRISCQNLELRVARDEDFPELVELIRGGIQDENLPMPFITDWHQQKFAPGEPDGFPASSLSWWWTQRATFAPDDWRLALTVRHDGKLVGMQDVSAKEFPLIRAVNTGSWLGREHHGRGIGTLMRRLVVHFALIELGAETCVSSYVVGNEASAAVSRKVGYLETERRRMVQHTSAGKVRVEEQRVVVIPHTFTGVPDDVRIEGAAPLRRFFGINNPD